MSDLTVQEFSDHAQLFGVKDAALMFRNAGYSLEWTLAYMRTAMGGMRVRFKAAEDNFDWLAVRWPRHWPIDCDFDPGPRRASNGMHIPPYLFPPAVRK